MLHCIRTNLSGRLKINFLGQKEENKKSIINLIY